MRGSGDEEDKADAMPSSPHCIVDAAVDPDRVVLRDRWWKEGGLMLMMRVFP